MEIPALIPLTDLDLFSYSSTGETAHQLQLLLQAGAPLPPTAVIPRDTLEYIAQQSDLKRRLQQVINHASSNNEQLLLQLQQVIKTTSIPDQVSLAIIKWYHQYGDYVRVISGTDKKLTNLDDNISGEVNLIDSILAAWTEHIQLTADLKQVQVYAEPIILQHQGQPTASGYAEINSADNKNHCQVYSVWGVYQPHHPEITPDHFTVDIRTENPVQRQLQPQYLRLKRTQDKLHQKPVKHYQQDQFSLDIAAVRLLARYTAAVKRKLYEDVRLYWYQEQEQLFVTFVEPLTLTKPTSQNSQVIVTGDCLGQGITGGNVVINPSPQTQLSANSILVVDKLTSKDTTHLSQAAAVICDEGVDTPLLVSQLQELEVPTILNTRFATTRLTDGQRVIVDANAGQVSKAPIPLTTESFVTDDQTPTLTKVFISAGNADRAQEYVSTAVDGVGVLRSEYTFARMGTHPLRLIRSHQRQKLHQELVRTITSFQNTKPQLPVIYRLQNFTSQELRSLAAASSYEPIETNPYLGYRGGIKMIGQFEQLDFELEVLADVLEQRHTPLGLLLPFIRTPAELQIIDRHLQKHPLRHHPHFSVYLQLNTPENVLQLRHYFTSNLDGVSVNVRSLHALLHGVDPDDPELYAHYPYDIQLMRQLLLEVLKVIHAAPYHPRSTHSRPQAILHLEDRHLELAEIAAKMGFDAVTVKPDFAPRVKARIRELEAHRYG